jgi:hypothetical protein
MGIKRLDSSEQRCTSLGHYGIKQGKHFTWGLGEEEHNWGTKKLRR